jgi:C4-dicarboxylate-specific signal transduction histidine kinase
VETKDRRMAFYTNLKPGHYKFLVSAANADGVWNKTGESLGIELRPHYYQSAWFLVLCGVLVCAAVFGVHNRRARVLGRKQQELQAARRFLEAEVENRTAELAKANTSLQQKTQSLESEIEARKKVQLEVVRAQQELLETSRLAGMSEIATNVLHNVGNVLNSINVTTSLVTDSVKQSKVENLAKVAALFRDHEQDLAAYLTADPKGRLVPSYLAKLSGHFQNEKAATLKELELLRENVEHIKEIIAMQQNYAKISGLKEIVNVQNLVEDSLRMNLDSMERHGVEIVRDYQDIPPVNVEKHKILQIIINLLRNAKYACEESGRPDKRLTVRVADGNGRLKITVEDNGVGIPRENLVRIFSHGFTTRKDGHGFGLHGSAIAAKEMGGSLTAHSDGPGLGACFTLELPIPAARAAAIFVQAAAVSA